MRDPGELLAMLCPKGLQVGQPFGGVPSLTALDIAGALGVAHLTPFQMQLLRVKYCLEVQHAPELAQRWKAEVVAKARRDWRDVTEDRLYLLALYTLHEQIQYNLCGTCDGRGEFYEELLKAECPECHGSGRSFASNVRLARMLGVSEATFRRSWTDRFAWCRRSLQAYETDALLAVRESLS